MATHRTNQRKDGSVRAVNRHSGQVRTFQSKARFDRWKGGGEKRKEDGPPTSKGQALARAVGKARGR